MTLPAKCHEACSEAANEEALKKILIANDAFNVWQHEPEFRFNIHGTFSIVLPKVASLFDLNDIKIKAEA